MSLASLGCRLDSLPGRIGSLLAILIGAVNVAEVIRALRRLEHRRGNLSVWAKQRACKA